MRGSALPGPCCPDRRATLWLGSGGVAAYLWPGLRLAPHSGSVACLVVGVDGPFRLRAGGREWRARSALVRARTVHHLVADDGRMLFVYVEPGTAHAVGLERGMDGRAGPVLVTHTDELTLVDRAARAEPGDLASLVAGLAPAGPDPVTDPRVGRALRIVRERPQDVTAPGLAAELGLSPSRMLHLFSAQTGTSFRRYRLWARILVVAGALSRGGDLTAAAVDAGFASPSHLSDTVRRMFGLTVTALLAGPVRLLVDDADGAGPP